MGDVDREIGLRIRQTRKALGLTGEELGAILCVGKGSVSKYERGESKVTPESLHKIAELGKVSIDWLVTGQTPDRTTVCAESQTAWCAQDPDEEILLRLFRDCDDEGRWDIMRAAQASYFRTQDKR